MARRKPTYSTEQDQQNLGGHDEDDEQPTDSGQRRDALTAKPVHRGFGCRNLGSVIFEGTRRVAGAFFGRLPFGCTDTSPAAEED